ncbi:transposase [Paenibacillus sp. CN-4]|uniref:transposase n=1 Tax=Paenibacillus nanchangensis TaxID=3348343 RepID=UPI003978EF40
MTDRERQVVQMFLPPARKSQGGRPPKDRRQMLNAILWVAHSGLPPNAIPRFFRTQRTLFLKFLGFWVALRTPDSFIRTENIQTKDSPRK